MFTLHSKNTDHTITLGELPTLRQAFVLAGTLVLGGLLLTHFIHEYFIALPILVGVGLLFSGFTGVCPMVLFLQQLPWNKKRWSTK